MACDKFSVEIGRDDSASDNKRPENWMKIIFASNRRKSSWQSVKRERNYVESIQKLRGVDSSSIQG